MDILVIGGGAAGLTAAISAARCGARVTVLEKMKKPGTKLLLTGNGRCNLSHADARLAEAYASVSGKAGEVRRFLDTLFHESGLDETLRFFLSLGISCRDREGYLYPRSMEARAVLAALLRELEHLKVRIRCSSPVTALSFDRSSGKWGARVGDWTYTADRVILAAGGKAAPKTGSDGSGCGLAKMAGHSVTRTVPALTGVLYTKEEKLLFEKCDGVRTKARVRLAEGPFFDASGEIQWTDRGLSGIVIFQMSRWASLSGPEHPLLLSIDLAEEMTEEALAEEMTEMITHNPNLTAAELLEAYVPEKLALCLAKHPVLRHPAPSKGAADHISSGEEDAPVHPGSPALVRHLASLLKDLRIHAAGTRGFEHAQVTAGGIPLAEIDPRTMESRIAPGLYLAGELVDADGPCGGYNLQWAWSSGAAAGRAAAAP